MMRLFLRALLSLSLAVVLTAPSAAQPNYDYSKLKRENLGRGLVAVRTSKKACAVSWRYLSSDPVNIGFNVYRDGRLLNSEPLMTTTYFVDRKAGSAAHVYEIRPVVNGRESEAEASYALATDSPIGYLNIPLDIPEGGVSPDGVEYTYNANDASIGDVDGDGEFEIILKWDPTNAHDNSHRGYTGSTILDCYKLDGTRLWRIDLGRNIRAGAHYTQFLVYDFDGDGRAEVVMKTADGTVDGMGNVIGDPSADYRNRDGFILDGPEYLTVFNGLTGEAMATVDYIPPRGGNGAGWGDEKGNRVDRFLACVAYLDGEYPSIVMCRGYYTRTVLAAFDWRDGKLTNRWVFDSDQPGNEAYAGQGNHNLRVGDVDGDGCDEIIYGSCTINNDGTGLYSTGMLHGDALHLTVFDASSGKLMVWDCHEPGKYGASFRDAETGEVIFSVLSDDDDGRCMAADIDPTNPGLEMWSKTSGGIRATDGTVINGSPDGVSINMACWWDGDLLRELQNGIQVTKYDWTTGGSRVLLNADGCAWNNGTKSNPCLQGDIFGDWREEVILRTADNRNLRIYMTDYETDYRFHTFLEDPVYRISIATQNIAYNQPTQPGFYFGAELGRMFPDKDIVVTENTYTADAGMEYDSMQWSTGGQKRTETIQWDEIPSNTSTRIRLRATYRGMQFEDWFNLTFIR